MQNISKNWRADIIMRKFVSVFMASFLALSISGCAKEAKNDITNNPSDSSDAAQTSGIDSTATAAWWSGMDIWYMKNTIRVWQKMMLTLFIRSQRV